MNILDLIGNTPTVEVMDTGKGKIYAKLEYFNPTGSVKDRAAYYMVKEALARGDIKNGKVIEATSGNTGIGLSMVCRAYKLECTIVMPENMSKERIAMMRAFGANVVLTPAALGMKGAVDKAHEMADETGAFMACQFDNKDNIKAHFETTAKEIFDNYPNIKWVVSPVGSGGTAMGIKKYIVENGIDAKVCAVEPDASPLLSKGIAGPHKIQGIGANILPSIVDIKAFDKIVQVTNDEAYEGARELSSEYGIFSGISSGSSLIGAKKLLEEESGDTLIIIPDSGARYMSVGLYE